MSQPDEPAADDHAAAPDGQPVRHVTPTAEGLGPDAARQAVACLHAVCTDLRSPDG